MCVKMLTHISTGYVKDKYNFILNLITFYALPSKGENKYV